VCGVSCLSILSAPISLSCSVVYSAGLHLQVQGRLHWSQITNTHSIITHISAGVFYFVAVILSHPCQLHMERNKSEVVPECNGSPLCDRHTACS